MAEGILQPRTENERKWKAGGFIRPKWQCVLIAAALFVSSANHLRYIDTCTVEKQ